MTISKRLDDLNIRINDACRVAHRNSDEVNLLAVSKTQSITAVKQAICAGHRHFGENYLQEAIAKIEACPEAEWHFIGSIQSNKTRDIANRFDWVHSVSSLKVARRLSEQRNPDKDPLKLLIQVNVSGESSKSGVSRDEAIRLAGDILPLGRVNLVGLMAIPEASTGETTQRRRFAELRTLRDDINAVHKVKLPHLSMGMSADFPQAIQEGATWIRIGTAIFGPRNQHTPGDS